MQRSGVPARISTGTASGPSWPGCCGGHGNCRDAFPSEGSGYRLAAGADDVDSLRFEQLAVEVIQPARAAETESGIDVLRIGPLGVGRVDFYVARCRALILLDLRPRPRPDRNHRLLLDSTTQLLPLLKEGVIGVVSTGFGPPIDVAQYRAVLVVVGRPGYRCVRRG